MLVGVANGGVIVHDDCVEFSVWDALESVLAHDRAFLDVGHLAGVLVLERVENEKEAIERR